MGNQGSVIHLFQEIYTILGGSLIRGFNVIPVVGISQAIVLNGSGKAVAFDKIIHLFHAGCMVSIFVQILHQTVGSVIVTDDNHFIEKFLQILGLVSCQTGRIHQGKQAIFGSLFQDSAHNIQLDETSGCLGLIVDGDGVSRGKVF